MQVVIKTGRYAYRNIHIELSVRADNDILNVAFPQFAGARGGIKKPGWRVWNDADEKREGRKMRGWCKTGDLRALPADAVLEAGAWLTENGAASYKRLLKELSAH